mmetsp:Transcript_51246/g.136788  ORF Transcript_51246/g.136788 Transcript_51246/m.136788 type:complete len:127 (-) Transcript_51246:284-664(-)
MGNQMGNHFCNCQDTAAQDIPVSTEIVAQLSTEAAPKADLDVIDITQVSGHWRRERDGKEMADISHTGMLSWAERYGHPVTKISVIEGRQLQMCLEGFLHEGIYENFQGRPSHIRWNDGDVWVRYD